MFLRLEKITKSKVTKCECKFVLIFLMKTEEHVLERTIKICALHGIENLKQVLTYVYIIFMCMQRRLMSTTQISYEK